MKLVCETVIALGAAAATLCSSPASAQSIEPAIFVANYGGVEGSVSSFTVNPDGTLNFVQKVITGSGQNHPGTGAQVIDISPNGRWLIVGHGTISTTFEQLTFIEVRNDASMNIAFTTTTLDSPVGAVWLNDEYVAVTGTPLGDDYIIIYKVNFDTQSITQHWYQTVPYTFDLVVDRANSMLYARADTSAVQPFRIRPDFTIVKATANPVPTGVFFLGPGLSPDGTKLYYGGGISSQGHSIGGFNIDVETGELTPIPGQPFQSPGVSPKQVVVSRNGDYAFASHGTDASIRGFRISPTTGALQENTLPGAEYTVGAQGDCGNMRVMGDLLFVTRRYSSSTYGPAGVLSFTIKQDGTLAQNGDTFSTQGSRPWDITVWPGVVSVCTADITGDGLVNVNDLLVVIGAWGNCPARGTCDGDITGDNAVNVDDLLMVLGAWGACE